MEGTWTSLEIVKVIISCLTPIIGGIIAWRLSQISKEVENKQWTDRKIIEKRLEIYDRVVPMLNDLYCFYKKIGNWKELTPSRVIELKRILDKDFYVNNHLFQTDILSPYNNFIATCFVMRTGEGHDAKIRADYSDRKNFIPEWEEDWKNLFKPEEKAEKTDIDKYYDRLINTFRSELGLK